MTNAVIIKPNRQTTEMTCNNNNNNNNIYPVVIETAGTWHHQAVELVKEIGRRTTNITGDDRETSYLFQQMSIALQRGNAVSFQNTFTAS